MVTLTQILDAREQRVARQQALLEQYGKSLICFTMNIAGPVKDSQLIRAGFRLGEKMLLAQLEGSGIHISHREAELPATGPTGFYVADADPLTLKKLTCEIEDSCPVARLFDMDVLAADGSKHSREQLGLTPRKCLICNEDAWICGRSRAHSVEQLQEKTNGLLQAALDEEFARKIAATAVQSLLWEVCTTPKPGLVDCQNSGSHKDMDIFTFTASAAVLHPYFEDCTRIGLETAELSPEETFARLRLPGKIAEQTMYAATVGVNTHKGAIFSLGILCAAAGRTKSCDADILLNQCAEMTRGLCDRELGASHSNGQALYAKYGTRGVRGQAEEGFPAVKTGLEILKNGLAQGYDLNNAGCAALLHMLLCAEDSNLLHRSDPDTYKNILRDLSSLLATNPYPTKAQLEELDAQFTQKNLSPGGSADSLALVYFLHLSAQNQPKNPIF